MFVEFVVKRFKQGWWRKSITAAVVIDGRIGDMPFTASSRNTHVYVEPSTTSFGNGNRNTDLTRVGQCGAQGFGNADRSAEGRRPAAGGSKD